MGVWGGGEGTPWALLPSWETPRQHSTDGGLVAWLQLPWPLLPPLLPEVPALWQASPLLSPDFFHKLGLEFTSFSDPLPDLSPGASREGRAAEEGAPPPLTVSGFSGCARLSDLVHMF